MSKDFIKELLKVCAKKTKEDVENLKNTLPKFQEDIGPFEMLNALSHTVNLCVGDFNDDDSKKIQASLAAAIKPVIIECAEIGQIPYMEIGSVLTKIGSAYMSMERHLPVLIEQMIEEDTFTDSDMEDVISSKIILSDIDTIIKLAQHFEVDVEEELKIVPNKENNKVLNSDKSVALGLIEKGLMSIESIKQLLGTGDLTLSDLVNGLSEKRFYEVVSDLHGAKEKPDTGRDEVTITREGPVMDKLKDIDATFDNIDKEAQLLNVMSRNENNISSEEKRIRRKVDDGSINNDEIVSAVLNNNLNPYYLTDNNKIDKKSLIYVAGEIAKKVKPELVDIFKHLDKFY